MRKKKNKTKFNVNFAKKGSKRVNVTTNSTELSAVLSGFEKIKQERDEALSRNKELERENHALKLELEKIQQKSSQNDTPTSPVDSPTKEELVKKFVSLNKGKDRAGYSNDDKSWID